MFTFEDYLGKFQKDNDATIVRDPHGYLFCAVEMLERFEGSCWCLCASGDSLAEAESFAPSNDKKLRRRLELFAISRADACRIVLQNCLPTECPNTKAFEEIWKRSKSSASPPAAKRRTESLWLWSAEALFESREEVARFDGALLEIDDPMLERLRSGATASGMTTQDFAWQLLRDGLEKHS